MSTLRRTPGIYASMAPRGQNGERLCRNCKGPMPKGARHNCSMKCSEEWMCKTSPSHLRYVLSRRDHGICAACGLDAVALKKEYRVFRDGEDKGWDSGEYGAKMPLEARKAWLSEHGIPYSRVETDWWDADHIIPVIEGGGECGPEGFRTLCIPCHKKATAELRQRMKQRRIEAKELPLLVGGSQ